MENAPGSGAASASDARIGTIVGGKYRLIRCLGKGGMGSVYEAENTWTTRRVAAKLLRPEYAHDRESADRFLREARAATQIAHPNIVEVLDMGQEDSDGSLFMVQELLAGNDLRRELERRRQLTPREALD